MLTGYVPGAEALLAVSQAVDRMRALNPRMVYLCDPVMGDEGRIYVSEAVIPIYKALMPKADCATPNYFEAQLLTDIEIVDPQSLCLCLRSFHERYALPNVIISAVSLPHHALRQAGLTNLPFSSLLVCAGSSIVSGPGEPLRTISFAIVFPELAEHYEGVGDVFSSLVLARFPAARALKEEISSPSPLAPHPISPLARTAELALASLQGIIANTRKHALVLAGGRADLLVGKEGEGVEERVRRLRMVELRLVQSHAEIINPVVIYHAVQLP